MQEFFLKEKGLYYRTNDFKEGRLTLVFVHGLTGSSSAWWPYEKIFENKYNVLTYDIRGHGKSKKFTHYADYEIKKNAEDLHDLVLYFKISKFILIGHSMGTLIIAEYAKLYPENVLGLIFLSPVFGVEKEFTGKILRPLLKLTGIFSLFPFNPKSGYHVDYTEFSNTTDWDIKRIYADSRNTTLHTHLYCLRQSMLLGQNYALEKIKVPTLIVCGKKDTMAPVKNSIALSNKIRNAELALIPETDHMVVLNNIKKVSEAIESFIEKHKGLLSKNY